MRRLALHRRADAAGLASGWAALLALAVVLIGAAALHAGVGVSRVLVLLLLAPVAEEIGFRAGLHEALLRYFARSGWANVATALIFALAHLALHGDPVALAVAVPALLIGAIYERTRRLGPCVALHTAMNAIWLSWALAA